MNKYIVVIRWNRPFDDEIKGLQPAERKRVAQLAQEGTVTGGYTRSDNQGGFLLFEADGEQRVRDEVETLPLYPYMDVEILQYEALQLPPALT